MSKKPFFREFDGWWYAQVRVGDKRKQVKLVKGKEKEQEAYRAFCRVMAEHDGKVPEPTRLTATSVCDLFLDHSEKHNGPRTFEWYKGYLQDFCEHFGRLMISDLRPFHVTRWLDKHPGWDGSRRCAVIAVKRAFNWAAGEGLIPTSPFRQVKKPPQRHRDRILTKDERTEILQAIRDRQFREFVQAMQETGCRPSEVSRVAAENVNLALGVWVFPEHKTAKKTGKPRVVYLTPTMVELTRKLMEKYPTGPLFRGPRGGGRFTRNGIRCRFRRLRKKLPHLKGVIAYAYRHTFATDALVNGVGIAQTAELLGHTSTDMVMRHYSHLSEKVEHMREAATRAAATSH